MTDGSASASALLGMEGFVVLGMTEEDGELWILVETTARAVSCAGCGTPAKIHGRPSSKVRDLPSGGRPVALVWRKRRWRCPAEDCAVRTFVETTPAVEGSLTRRAAKEICRLVGQDDTAVAVTARQFGVSWATAMECVRRHGRPLVDDDADRLAKVQALGVDEHKMLAANGKRNTVYATSFVDVRRGRLLDVIPGRNADDVAYWLSQAAPVWRQGVDAVAIDPHRGYHVGLLRYLPDAVVTIDKFHAVKLANTAVDDVRRRVQRDTLGHRGRKHDPLYRTRRLMTRGFERLTPRQRGKLFDALAEGDPDGAVAATLHGKELLREVYAAGDLRAARWRLVAFYQHAVEAGVPELLRLARTIDAWESEVLNVFITGVSNGPTEAQNLITEKVRRVAHGFRNFDNYRLRLLLHSGVQWQTHVTVRIRGRKSQPRLAA